MSKQKIKRKRRVLGAVGNIFVKRKREGTKNQRSVGGLLQLFERPWRLPRSRAARENGKRNEKATWAPVEADVRKEDSGERVMVHFRSRRDHIHLPWELRLRLSIVFTKATSRPVVKAPDSLPLIYWSTAGLGALGLGSELLRYYGCHGRLPSLSPVLSDLDLSEIVTIKKRQCSDQ